MIKKKILIIGGSGYIGQEICTHLLKNKKILEVESLDILLYPGQKNNEFLKKNKKFNFTKGDFRNKKLLKECIEDKTDIVVLAGLVGDPITKKYQKLSNKINLKGIKDLISNINKIVKKNQTKLIFVSTCSNYGILRNKLASENDKLKPLSLYAKSKVNIEKFLLNKNFKFSSVILRFATAFGLSSRMRFDLTVNDFCKQLFFKKNLTVYDPNTWRPYCHVKDFSRLIEKIIFTDNKKINKQIFNAGSTRNNFKKIQIARKIQKYIPKSTLTFIKGDVDPRDYRVNFKKLDNFGFKAKYSLDYGIKEILNFLKRNKKNKSNLNLGNYKINIKNI